MQWWCRNCQKASERERVEKRKKAEVEAACKAASNEVKKQEQAQVALQSSQESEFKLCKNCQTMKAKDKFFTNEATGELAPYCKSCYITAEKLRNNQRNGRKLLTT